MGQSVEALAQNGPGTCIAIVDHNQVWHRDLGGRWSQLATASHGLQSIAAFQGSIFAGGSDEPVLLRISGEGRVERLNAFDQTLGREDWIANGPPLGVRSLAATSNAVFAAVHVGGIPRSIDNGETWSPTIPILHDAHEVCSHPTRPDFVAAAAAVGLYVSRDSGKNWKLYQAASPFGSQKAGSGESGSRETSALAVAILEHEVLFSLQDGPFAKQSQLWRWHMESAHLEQVRDGLPVWLQGRIDTHWLVAAHRQAALADDGGNLWWSRTGSTSWQHVAVIPPYVFGLLIL